jgi:hypothetical protein
MTDIIEQIKLIIIIISHIIIVLFVILTPFTKSNYLLFMHSFILPFIMLHWVSNNDICALTALEKHIRKKLSENNTDLDCFTCRIINPVFNFDKKYENKFNYTVMIVLWIITLYKLHRKYKNKEIRNFYDLFIL